MCKRVLLLLYILSSICVTLDAKRRLVQEPAFPTVWHRPDRALANPMLSDTIALPEAYTMMMVYKPLEASASQQLWRLSRMDKRYYSVGTCAIRTEQSVIPFRTDSNLPVPCIYTLQHTIPPDTSYHDMVQLFVGADSEQDTTHVVLYEMAYFDSRLSVAQSIPFQTYLALRYGITLDGVSYVSTAGDTLWNAKESKEYYHHIQGLGTSAMYSFRTTQSVSLEDSTVCVLTEDTLPDDSYILIGDNAADMSWRSYENSWAVLQRIWKMAAIGTYAHAIHLKVDAGQLPMEGVDTLYVVLLNQEGKVVQWNTPDSVTQDRYHYYTLFPYDGTCFTMGANFSYPSSSVGTRHHRQKQEQKEETYDYVTITPNPTDGDFIVSIQLAEEKSVSILIQDMSGKTIHYQPLNAIRDFQYKGSISTSGVYMVSIVDTKHNRIATKELIVL